MRKIVLILLSLVFCLGLNAQKKAKKILAPQLNKSLVKKLGYDKSRFTKKDATTWTLDNGITIYSTYPYGQKVKGFVGPTPLFIAVDSHRKIVSMAAAANRETPEYFKKAKVLLKAWNGKTLQVAKDFTPDAVSGATMSSKAIIQTVHASVSHLD